MSNRFSIETLGELKLPLANLNDIAKNQFIDFKAPQTKNPSFRSFYAEPAICKRLNSGARIFLSQDIHSLLTKHNPTEHEIKQIAELKKNFQPIQPEKTKSINGKTYYGFKAKYSSHILAKPVSNYFKKFDEHTTKNLTPIALFKRDKKTNDLPESQNPIQIIAEGFACNDDIMSEHETYLSFHQSILPSKNHLSQKNICQSWMGDCSLLAGLISITYRDQAKNKNIKDSAEHSHYIHSIMQQNAYTTTVRLFEKDPNDSKKTRPVYVTVDNSIFFANDSDGSNRTIDHKKPWVHIIEKAFAGLAPTKDPNIKKFPSLLDMYGKGIKPSVVLETLTGNKSTEIQIKQNVLHDYLFNNDSLYLAQLKLNSVLDKADLYDDQAKKTVFDEICHFKENPDSDLAKLKVFETMSIKNIFLFSLIMPHLINFKPGFFDIPDQKNLSNLPYDFPLTDPDTWKNTFHKIKNLSASQHEDFKEKAITEFINLVGIFPENLTTANVKSFSDSLNNLKNKFQQDKNFKLDQVNINYLEFIHYGIFCYLQNHFSKSIIPNYQKPKEKIFATLNSQIQNHSILKNLFEHFANKFGTQSNLLPGSNGTGIYNQEQETIFADIKNHCEHKTERYAIIATCGNTKKENGEKTFHKSNVTGLFANHSYGVLGTTEENNKKYIILANPWGIRGRQRIQSASGVSITTETSDGSVKIEINEFTKYFNSYYYAEIPKTPTPTPAPNNPIQSDLALQNLISELRRHLKKLEEEINNQFNFFGLLPIKMSHIKISKIRGVERLIQYLEKYLQEKHIDKVSQSYPSIEQMIQQVKKEGYGNLFDGIFSHRIKDMCQTAIHEAKREAKQTEQPFIL